MTLSEADCTFTNKVPRAGGSGCDASGELYVAAGVPAKLEGSEEDIVTGIGSSSVDDAESHGTVVGLLSHLSMLVESSEMSLAPIIRWSFNGVRKNRCELSD